MKKICYIVGAGDCTGMEITRNDGDIIIAADGGFARLADIDIVPDIAVGDFDSLGYKPSCAEVIAHPPEKDDTDTGLAISIGIEKGYENFIIFGGLGGRIEHSIANIQSIASIAERGLRAWLWGEGTAITVINNSEIVFPDNCTGYFSVFSHGDTANGVTLKNLKYEIEDCDLKNTYPIGVSNEFIGKVATVSVTDGMLQLVWNCSASELHNII